MKPGTAIQRLPQKIVVVMHKNLHLDMYDLPQACDTPYKPNQPRIAQLRGLQLFEDTNNYADSEWQIK